MNEPTQLSVCTDCILVLSNGAESDEEAQAGERMSTIWAGYDIVLGGADLGFSMATCDGCDSHLGGDRFEAWAFDKPNYV